MKVFTGGIVTETNTFAPFPTARGDWRCSDDPNGSGMEPFFELITRLAVERGWSTVTGFHAMAEPAGRTMADAWAYMKGRLLEDLQNAMPVDLVVLPLHGAMIAEGCDDCEGNLLAEIRAIVGPEIPVGSGLDSHAHLSRRMVEAADILVFMKEWPHTDVMQTIEKAFLLTAGMAEGKTRPHMAVWDCRMIAPYHTLEDPMKSLVDEMKATERDRGVLSVSLVHGFWQADVPDMGSKMLVITDDRPVLGRQLAEEFGRRLFEIRGQTAPGYLDLEQGLDVIRCATKFPIVAADVGDIPGGGAPGDATYVLEGLLAAGIRGAVIAYIWDMESVEHAVEAGIGSQLQLEVGGKSCKQSGRTLSLDCRVEGVFQDLTVPGVEGAEQGLGDVVVVESSGVRIALSHERVSALSSSHFEALGIDPAACKVLVIKSANNFYAGFEAVAAETIYIDAGGVTGGRIEDLSFRRIERPKWPIDPDPFA